MFLEALKKVNTHFGNRAFTAVILGSHQGRELYKKKLIRLVEQYRLQNYVKFIEKCDLMPIAYKVSDIIVSSSIEPEAFGRVSIEAQSMEKPIVASNIGGSKETIIQDKTGYFYKNKDPVDLANSLVTVMQKNYNLLKSIGIEGRKNVLKKFDVDKMCQTTFTEYKKLIELS